MATFSGPVFNGMADVIVDRNLAAAEMDVAEAGHGLVQTNLAGSLQNPTGRYQRATQVRPGGGGHEVSDGGVVYGPWLEGVGSRNRSTRFKGYWSYRRAMQSLRGMAPRIISEHEDRMTRELNG
jgi:hypothetical protein